MSDPTALPNFPPPPDEHPLRGRVLDVLQDLKLEPNLDKDGDVSFTARNQKMFVRIREGDIDMMRIFGQWRIADTMPQELTTRLNACNNVTLGVNVVKAGIAGGALVLATDHMIAKTEDVKVKVAVSVDLILKGLQMWHKTITKAAGTDGGSPDDGSGGTPEAEQGDAEGRGA